MSCESGLSVYVAGPGVRILFLVDTCASQVHQEFDPVVPDGYLLPNIYMFMQISQI